MADFESACDRLNGTWRSDFYEQYALPHQLGQLQPFLQDFQDDYNFERPHDAIALQTPYERLEKIRHSDDPA
jgi:transposase InsO family protein